MALTVVAYRLVFGTGSQHHGRGNDYPHGDSLFPHSQKVLGEIMADCTAQERFDMTVGNVVDLYQLPFAH